MNLRLQTVQILQIKTTIFTTSKIKNKGVKLLLSNGRPWIYSISLLASQYSFDSSLEV